jgi:hypothetical protein
VSAIRTVGFAKEAYSPVIDRAFRGVKIAWSAPAPAPSGFPSLCLAIVYLLDDAQAEALGGKPPAEALVLTAVSGLAVYSENILRDVQVFEDDYRRRDGLWLGYVNLKPVEHFRWTPEREFHLTVSLGACLSNTLHLPKTQV